jgi:hypothetical protein
MSLQDNNLSSVDPAAPTNGVNVVWQADAPSADSSVTRNISGYVPAAGAAALGVVKPDGSTMQVDATGKLSATGSVPSLEITSPTTASAASSGSASALPASPVGYLVISVGGSLVKIPYFAV